MRRLGVSLSTWCLCLAAVLTSCDLIPSDGKNPPDDEAVDAFRILLQQVDYLIPPTYPATVVNDSLTKSGMTGNVVYTGSAVSQDFASGRHGKCHVSAEFSDYRISSSYNGVDEYNSFDGHTDYYFLYLFRYSRVWIFEDSEFITWSQELSARSMRIAWDCGKGAHSVSIRKVSASGYSNGNWYGSMTLDSGYSFAFGCWIPANLMGLQ